MLTIIFIRTPVNSQLQTNQITFTTSMQRRSLATTIISHVVAYISNSRFTNRRTIENYGWRGPSASIWTCNAWPSRRRSFGWPEGEGGFRLRIYGQQVKSNGDRERKWWDKERGKTTEFQVSNKHLPAFGCGALDSFRGKYRARPSDALGYFWALSWGEPRNLSGMLMSLYTTYE